MKSAPTFFVGRQVSGTRAFARPQKMSGRGEWPEEDPQPNHWLQKRKVRFADEVERVQWLEKRDAFMFEAQAGIRMACTPTVEVKMPGTPETESVITCGSEGCWARTEVQSVATQEEGCSWSGDGERIQMFETDRAPFEIGPFDMEYIEEVKDILSVHVGEQRVILEMGGEAWAYEARAP